MLTGISGKDLNSKHCFSDKFSVGTSEKIKENLEDLLKNKPDGKLIHDGTNDITNGVNLLNS